MRTMMSHLRAEIAEQPDALRRLMTNERAKIEQVAASIRQRAPKFVMLAARGSSDNAARYAQYLFGAVNRLPVALATPSLFTLYKSPPQMADALVIAISQSGQSPDIVGVIEEARQQGALTVALSNDAASPLAAAAEHVINLHSGPEKAVAATKTYTTSLAAIALLSHAISQSDAAFQAVEQVAAVMESITGQADAIIAASERYRYMEACVVVSRGYNYATSYEIALKLKELTYILAEPYSSADFRHGPVALVAHGFPVIAILPEGPSFAEMLRFLAELKQRGAELIVVSAQDEALALAQTPLRVPSGLAEWVSPLALVMPGQLFALGLTIAKGYDVDQPRNIQKVTLTR